MKKTLVIIIGKNVTTKRLVLSIVITVMYSYPLEEAHSITVIHQIR